MVGAIGGLKESLRMGLLNRAESIILADAFEDWLEQAKHLFERDYVLGAGVIGRAVLESHLRKWCERAGCSPLKDRPTIEDFKGALYSNSHLTKTEMKHVEAMTAIGNDAAHAKPELTSEQVERLLSGLTAFLATHPLP